jgi:hypothetical protein
MARGIREVVGAVVGYMRDTFASIGSAQARLLESQAKALHRATGGADDSRPAPDEGAGDKVDRGS